MKRQTGLLTMALTSKTTGRNNGSDTRLGAGVAFLWSGEVALSPEMPGGLCGHVLVSRLCSTVPVTSCMIKVPFFGYGDSWICCRCRAECVAHLQPLSRDVS